MSNLTIFAIVDKVIQPDIMSQRPAKRIKTPIFTLFLTVLIISSIPVFGQKDSLKANYIKEYSALAVSEMRRSGIPASITMAQAIIESDIGRSDLATIANNHFGIKCHKTWEGKRFYYDDDKKDECFRVYQDPVESYQDHSIFLLTRDRYKKLFNLDPLDYKGWARGLKSAGYATNPRYAEMLIRVIEEEKLYQLDNWINPAYSRNSTDDDGVTGKPYPVHQTSGSTLPSYFHRNRIDFVIAERGETVESLTEKLDMFKWEIRKYNELGPEEELRAGDIVYLQPKRKRAARGFDVHFVRPGETIHSISQHFGIKSKWLLKRNNMVEGERLKQGDKIWLRGKKPEKKK